MNAKQLREISNKNQDNKTLQKIVTEILKGAEYEASQGKKEFATSFGCDYFRAWQSAVTELLQDKGFEVSVAMDYAPRININYMRITVRW